MVVQEAPVAKSCDARSACCVEALESGAHGMLGGAAEGDRYGRVMMKEWYHMMYRLFNLAQSKKKFCNCVRVLDQGMLWASDEICSLSLH